MEQARSARDRETEWLLRLAEIAVHGAPDFADHDIPHIRQIGYLSAIASAVCPDAGHLRDTATRALDELRKRGEVVQPPTRGHETADAFRAYWGAAEAADPTRLRSELPAHILAAKARDRKAQ
jgi:hypothetical protein